MAEPLKISDIAKVLFDYYLSPEEKEINSVQKLAVRINRMLVETGDLTESAIGKIETKQGAEHGICGEIREKEDHTRYWIPLYSIGAYRYVEKQFLERYSSIIDKPKEKTDKTNKKIKPPKKAEDKKSVKDSKKPVGRKVWKQLKAEYKNKYQIILVEAPNGFWTFDSDAELLATLCNTSLKKGTDKHNLVYNKTGHVKVIKALEHAGINYLVAPHTKADNTTKKDKQKTEKPTVNVKRVRESIKFILLEPDGTQLKCIIQEYEGEISTVEHVDGTEHIFVNPVTEYEDCLSLSPTTPLAKSALGHKLGDSFLCKNVEYKIIYIESDVID